ncbi:hypothetical protein AMTRI_Chr01g127970 [Amborella trichopoda]
MALHLLSTKPLLLHLNKPLSPQNHYPKPLFSPKIMKYPRNPLSFSSQPTFSHGCKTLKSNHLTPNYPSKIPILPPILCLFTGLVEEIGHIKQTGFKIEDKFVMKITARTVLTGITLGDSIAVNGACLTVTDFDAEGFTVGLAPETRRKTNLGDLLLGSPVNLERALQPTARMGGHIVQGHVDGTGSIVMKREEGDSLWVKIRVSDELMRYIVPKGFIAVDGTSLTVVDVIDEEGCFTFMLVAYTQEKVIIATKEVGDRVNLEVDILGKYVERLLRLGPNPNPNPKLSDSS